MNLAVVLGSPVERREVLEVFSRFDHVIMFNGSVADIENRFPHWSEVPFYILMYSVYCFFYLKLEWLVFELY